MGRDSMGFCGCPAGPDCRGECEGERMVGCRHRWGLRDVRAPFTAMGVCESCGAVVRLVFEPGATQSKLHVVVHNYGHSGLSLDDLDAVVARLGRQLQRQLEEVKEPAQARPVRHKKRKRAA